MTAYQKYQLQWMINHNKSLDDLMSELTQHQINGCEETVDMIFDEWEHEVGFDGEIWACPTEWEDCEAQEDPPELSDALDECDTIILVGGLDAYDNSKKLYAENKEFRNEEG